MRTFFAMLFSLLLFIFPRGIRVSVAILDSWHESRYFVDLKMTTPNNKQAGERTQSTPNWKVKLISGWAAHRADGSHDVQITVQINAVGYGNQLQVIRKLTAAPELLQALSLLCRKASANECFRKHDNDALEYALTILDKIERNAS